MDDQPGHLLPGVGVTEPGEKRPNEDGQDDYEGIGKGPMMDIWGRNTFRIARIARRMDGGQEA